MPSLWGWQNQTNEPCWRCSNSLATEQFWYSQVNKVKERAGGWGELQVYLLDATREPSWKDALRIMEMALEVPRGQGFRGWVLTHNRLFRRQMTFDHFCAKASSEPDTTTHRLFLCQGLEAPSQKVRGARWGLNTSSAYHQLWDLGWVLYPFPVSVSSPGNRGK